MPPSFVAILRCETSQTQNDSLSKLNKLFDNKDSVKGNLKSLLQGLSPWEISYILFSDEDDEKKLSNGARGLYHIPSYGNLGYCGLMGLKTPLQEAQKSYTKHHLYNNLREGDWLLDYIMSRGHSAQGQIGQFYDLFGSWLKLIKNLPRHLIPSFFSCLMEEIVFPVLTDGMENGGTLGQKSSEFLSSLQVACFQIFSPLLNRPDKKNLVNSFKHPTRELFISFNSVFLLNKLYREGRELLLAYASFLRHGLIPNIQAGGNGSRYNCRDVPWLYLKSVANYVRATKDHTIFNEMIGLQYLSDTKEIHEKLTALAVNQYVSFSDVILRIFQAHASGIRFREWDAGVNLDPNAHHVSFDIELYTNLTNGFIYGGSPQNGLTWMDFIGTSKRAHNKGKPATSR